MVFYHGENLHVPTESNERGLDRPFEEIQWTSTAESVQTVKTLMIQGKQVSLAVSHDGPIYRIPID